MTSLGRLFKLLVHKKTLPQPVFNADSAERLAAPGILSHPPNIKTFPNLPLW